MQNLLSYKISYYAFGVLVIIAILFLIQRNTVKRLHKQKQLLKSISNISKAVRYGNLLGRLDDSFSEIDSSVVLDFNNMLESIEDREMMIEEYKKELDRKNHYLNALFNSLNDAIITVNSDFSVITANNKMCSLLDVSNERELRDKNIAQIIDCDFSNDCQNCTKFSDDCFFLMQSHSNQDHHVNLKTTIDSHKLYSFSSSLFYDSSDIANYVIVLSDITKEIEIQKIRTNFVATLTHDIRVPILAVSNTLKLFLKDVFGDLNIRQKEAITNMLDSNNELISLVNCVLDTYKFDEGNYDLLLEESNLANLIKSIIVEFKFMAEKNTISLSCSIPQNLPLIHIDKNEIKRVLRNLINNALLYSNKGGTVNVETYIKDNSIYVDVIDDGVGITEDDLPKVFERYYSTSKKFRKVGTGLGLYLSKAIIEKHNGEIFVKSIQGEGSTFTFTLPLT